VKLIASGPAGSSTNTRANYIVVSSAPPVASFSGSPTSGTEPLNVTFTDTSTGNITARSWDFGDTSTTNVTTNSVMHTYAAGTYDVALAVTGPGGDNTNTQTAYITAYTAFQSWQILHFGSTTNSAAAPTADPDGDGQNNQAEFQAGTDPLNSSDYLHIVSVFNIPGADIVTWTSVTSKTYQAEISLDLTGGIWSNVGSALAAGPGRATLSETNAVDLTLSNRFYRILLVP
jgi:PKD repeat protein